MSGVLYDSTTMQSLCDGVVILSVLVAQEMWRALLQMFPCIPVPQVLSCIGLDSLFTAHVVGLS